MEFCLRRNGLFYGPLAQLVEQLTLNQRVRSSILRRPFLRSALLGEGLGHTLREWRNWQTR